MLSFILIFPMLVHDLEVDLSNEVWLFFVTIRKIIGICFTKSLNIEMIDFLNLQISIHHDLYLKLFNDTLKPMHHNMMHYPEIIKQSGPLAYLSVMRFKSKHKELKTIATATTS